jgi:hypothetical protein
MLHTGSFQKHNTKTLETTISWMRIIECRIIFLTLNRIFNRQIQVKGIVINKTSGRIRTNTKASMKKIIAALVFGCILLTSVWFLASKVASSSVPSTSIPQPAATATMVLPTPSSPGNAILWKDLQVTMDQPEFTEVYETDYGSSRFPPSGGKFLWVHIGLKNTSQVEAAIPLAENFSVLYASTELKPTYGHRNGYKDYTTLVPVIFPEQSMAGWLRFDVPATAEFSDMLFVYLPESSQVGASYSSPNYPYADDKPTYVWDFVP